MTYGYIWNTWIHKIPTFPSTFSCKEERIEQLEQTWKWCLKSQYNNTSLEPIHTLFVSFLKNLKGKGLSCIIQVLNLLSILNIVKHRLHVWVNLETVSSSHKPQEICPMSKTYLAKYSLVGVFRKSEKRTFKFQVCLKGNLIWRLGIFVMKGRKQIPVFVCKKNRNVNWKDICGQSVGWAERELNFYSTASIFRCASYIIFAPAKINV